MIKKIMLLILSIALIMGLSACTVNINLGDGEENEVSKVKDSLEQSEKVEEEQEISGEVKEEKKEEEKLPSEEKVENTTNLTLEDAKEIFSQNYPEVPIEVAKTEGNAYYIEGYNGGDICKMKIIASTGEIVLNKKITTGRNGGYNK